MQRCKTQRTQYQRSELNNAMQCSRPTVQQLVGYIYYTDYKIFVIERAGFGDEFFIMLTWDNDNDWVWGAVAYSNAVYVRYWLNTLKELIVSIIKQVSDRRQITKCDLLRLHRNASSLLYVTDLSLNTVFLLRPRSLNVWLYFPRSSAS